MPTATPVQRWTWNSARRKKVFFGCIQKPTAARFYNLAPRYAHTLSRSANTPPAVTAGPAPDPWTRSWSGPRPLDDQRISVVSARDEPHDVIGQVDVGEWMRPIELDESNGRT